MRGRRDCVELRRTFDRVVVPASRHDLLKMTITSFDNSGVVDAARGESERPHDTVSPPGSDRRNGSHLSQDKHTPNNAGGQDAIDDLQ